MSTFVVWIDREHAKTFQFSDEKMERKNLQAKHQEHHTHRIDQADHNRHETSLFSEVALNIANAHRILILGPGVAKHHLQNFLCEQHPALAKKIVGCETVDHPTDSQIAAFARKFFSIETTA